MNCQRLGAAVLAVALVVLLAGVVSAKKPAKPPVEPADGGRIYLNYGRASILADGSDWTATADGVQGVPSEAPHWCAETGHEQYERWFLDVRPLDPDPDEETETYPNGVYRRELFAVSETGVIHQLTDAPDVEPDHLVMNAGTQPLTWVPRPQWAAGDTLVSYMAKRWEGGEVVEWGLYVLEIDAENLEDHAAGTPTWIPVTMPLLFADVHPESGGHVNVKYAWAPDGASFVYSSCLLGGGRGAGPILRADYAESADSWSTTQLVPQGIVDGWAPVPDRILLHADGWLTSMDPYDATDVAALLPTFVSTNRLQTSIHDACWSPSGTHLAYHVRETTWKGVDTNSVRVAAADGSDPTNVTSDLDAAWLWECGSWVGD